MEKLTITHGEFTVKQGEYGFDRLYVRRDLIIGCLYAVGKRYFRAKHFSIPYSWKIYLLKHMNVILWESVLCTEKVTLSIVRVGHDGSKTQSIKSIELRHKLA